jgi:PAS domain-containing protein
MDARTSLLSEAADSLALAVIASSNAPVLLIRGDLTIIAASESFCDTFEIDPDRTAGLPLAELGAGEWGVPQLASLLRRLRLDLVPFAIRALAFPRTTPVLNRASVPVSSKHLLIS